ncbi:MAG: RimK/LysX family protein [Halioglobus sp.]
MNFRIRYISSVCFVLFVLAGCATVEPVKNERDPRLDQMVAGIDQCLANQVQTTTQLQNQAQQLQLQLQQMQAMSEQIEEAKRAGKENASPAIIDCPKPPKVSNKQVIGYMEQVWMTDLDAPLTALIDTSMETSALDVQNIEQFERDGKRWVKFDVPNSTTGQPVSLEHKIKRTVGSSTVDEANRRPVIRMGIIIGRLNQTADFVLYERKHKTYQVKLGRNILQDVMVVDVSKKNIAPYERPEEAAASAGSAK